jgi:histidine triad (HIT) family protein
MKPCPFCAIIDGSAPAPDLEWDHGVASFTPLNPVTPGHRLFIPRVHVQDAAQGPSWAARVVDLASRYAHDRGGAFNLITSAGAAATQTIQHLHIHYVPRRDGDGLHLPWTGRETTQ